MRNILFLLTVILLLSCSNEEDKYSCESTIHIPKQMNNIGDFDNYFKYYEFVKLETKPNCLIYNIDKLYILKNNIYILDEKQNSILTFNNEGKFKYKIDKVGKGPSEYSNISDFIVDENLNRILVYSDYSMKVIEYDLNGKFISDFNVKDYYKSIYFYDNKLIFFDVSPLHDKYFFEYNYTSNKLVTEHVSVSSLTKKYNSQATIYPMSNTSINNYFYAPLDYRIFQIDDGTIKVKYCLNFENEIPSDFLSQEIQNKELYNTLKEKEYAFYISNFRETKDYIIFKYEPNKLVIYYKPLGIANVFSAIKNNSTGFYFSNYFAHNGNDNSIVEIVNPTDLKFMVNRFGDFSDIKDKTFFELDNELKNTDNPIIIKYYFK